MRPRKRILLYGGSEMTQSILRLVLDSRGYAVETEFCRAPDVFLVIGFTEPEREAFEAQRWQACRQSRVVSVSENHFGQFGGTADLLNKVRLAARRKRGPVRIAKLAEMELAA